MRQWKDHHRPIPSQHRANPRGARPPGTARHSTDLTPQEPHWLAPINHQTLHKGREGTPTRGGEGTPIEGAAKNAATQATSTHSPPDDNAGHNKGHHTSNGTGTR